jgi:hypothetical protein
MQQQKQIQIQSNTAIGAVTLATSLLNRVGTNFLEVGNTRVLKNVGITHIRSRPKDYKSATFDPKTKIFSVLKDIWKTEGIAGYFRGINSGIGLSLVRSGVFFPIYENSKFYPTV